jgi:hypothetical protein
MLNISIRSLWNPCQKLSRHGKEQFEKSAANRRK